MKYLLKVICFCSLVFFSVSAFSQSSTIYSVKIDSIKNSESIDFSTYAGKKILLVNAAILDTNYYQWRELEQLQKLYQEKLRVVILPPTNLSEQVVANFFQSNNFSFAVGSLLTVNNNSIVKLREWLSKKSLNGLTDSNSIAGFEKYLINEDGQLINVFEPMLAPLSAKIENAINAHD